MKAGTADQANIEREAASVGPQNVLVVDDDVLVLAGTAGMLEDLGHQVVQVTSGQEALEALAKNVGFNLIITDQAMPGMTGVQLSNAIKAKWPDMPIILATGYAELPPGTDPTLLRLNKPFFTNALSAAVAEAMSRKAGYGKLLPFRPRETAADG